jgi:hypothetical protein
MSWGPGRLREGLPLVRAVGQTRRKLVPSAEIGDLGGSSGCSKCPAAESGRTGSRTQGKEIE